MLFRSVPNWRSVVSGLISPGYEGEFYYPAKIATGPGGRIYVSDSYNNRVQVFTGKGEYLTQWGGMGFWRGRFRVASGIAVDKKGRVFVADYYNNRVQVFTEDGGFIASFGKEGTGPGEFMGPTGVALGPKGKIIYVVDWGNHRVESFRISD